MRLKDAIGTEKNVTLSANWRYRRSRCKRIQLYRTGLQEVSGPIRIKLKKLLSRQIVIFRANFFRPPSKIPSGTPIDIVYLSESFLFRLWQDSHKSTQGWKYSFWESVKENSVWIIKWTTLLGIFCKINFTPAVTSCYQVHALNADAHLSAALLCLGIPHFCDWKPGHFRTKSLNRLMWFIS